MDIHIATPRLHLRELSESDLPAFHRLQSSPQVTRFTKQGPNKTLERSSQMLDDLLVLVNMMRSYDTKNTPVILLAITLPSSPSPDELIGLIGTFRPLEVGFSLHEDFWGLGYATEALRGFCDWYRGVFKGQKLFAKVDAANEGSKRCLRKGGFVEASWEEEAEFGGLDGKEGERDGGRETWVLR